MEQLPLKVEPVLTKEQERLLAVLDKVLLNIEDVICDKNVNQEVKDLIGYKVKMILEEYSFTARS